MPRGDGFLHLNTPAAISYSPGQEISLSDLRHGSTREQCVVLPRSVGVWRLAFKRYVKEEGLSQFVSDIEAEREGDGPLLPPLKAVPVASAALKDQMAQNTQQNTGAAAAAPADASLTTKDGCEAKKKGIVIVSHHKVSGEQRFVYPDHDGVLSSGFVPKVVISEEEKAEIDENKKHYVSPLDLSEEERVALEELQMLWKNRANSRSDQGAKHRVVAGNILPDASAQFFVDDRGDVVSAGQSMLGRHAPSLLGREENFELNTGNTLDDALRLASDLLDNI